ncbi:hypothetical protein XF_a0056 (plasmid) [Xylella fastidiosa 9a5c]|uniref:Uncharacterized protein n=1 Tax=Xylella fastidiosa (strain 9a5c) TaxID=160492 RepID=Q9PHF2_XYLFA|nr:hypothetical protein XF_a0056 [Xylella fastidiosa 9a5c]
MGKGPKGPVRVAHCPYGALGGGACGQRLAAVGNGFSVVHGRKSVRVAHCPQIHGLFAFACFVVCIFAPAKILNLNHQSFRPYPLQGCGPGLWPRLLPANQTVHRTVWRWGAWPSSYYGVPQPLRLASRGEGVRPVFYPCISNTGFFI